MVFQNDILAGSSGVTGTSSAVYKIDQSIRFDSASDALMYSPTPSSSKSFTTTATISMWVKLGDVGQHYLAGAYYSTGGRYELIMMDSSNRLRADGRSGGASASSGTGVTKWTTTQVFRDPSAWYHLVFVYDTTNAVQSERFRLYVNGARVTDFATAPSYGASELVYWFGKSSYTVLGSFWNTTGYDNTFYWDGYMAEVHGIDGTALDQDSFGEFNSSGIWIPKEYSGSHGTDGFYIKGADASALGTNSASNNNTFTLNAISAHDQVLDSPTNNFAVLSPIDKGSMTLSQGNLKGTSGSGSVWQTSKATMGVKSGKWYWEVRAGGTTYNLHGTVGLAQTLNTTASIHPGVPSDGYGWYGNNGKFYHNNSPLSTESTYTTGDIISFALDLDDSGGILAAYKNGVLEGNLTTTYKTADTDDFIFPAVGLLSSDTCIINFGQEGTFAGNVTAGGNSDGNGIGNFKYSVPSGYLALCTKNLGS